MQNLTTKLKNLNIIISLLLLTVTLSCQTNPATGENDFNIMSEKEEIMIGKSEHKKILKEFGGVYNDEKLSNYVNSIGQFLSKTSELPNLKFTFTILDTHIVNAFALPGGYIYITRGLIAICQNEAQLAGVIAHEIAHVTARHSARRYSKNIGTNVLANILGTIANNPMIGNLINQSAVLYLLSYSRDQEYEADKLAVRYMNRAGFDSKEMANFLEIMGKYSKFEAKKMDRKSRNNSDFLSTHPSSIKRVLAVLEKSKNNIIPNPIKGEEIFLKKIDGLVFGNKVDEGILTSSFFLYPKLKFKFKLPENFYFINTPSYVIGIDEEKSKIILDVDKVSKNISVLDYIKNWSKVTNDKNIEVFKINDLEYATSFVLKKNEELRFGIIRNDTNIYRFVLIQKTLKRKKINFNNILKNLSLITDTETKLIQPNKIKVYSVREKKDIQSLISRQNIQKKYSLETFKIINNIGNIEQTKKKKVKVISNNYF